MVDLYHSSKLKETCDEALELVLDGQGYTQIYSPEFIRLGFESLNVLTGACVFFAERKWGWSAIYDNIVAAVVVHTVLTIVVKLWKFMYERNATYIGRSPSGALVFIGTKCVNYEDYEVSVADNEDHVNKGTVTFAEIFDYNGKVVREKLTDFLKPLISDDVKDKAQ